MTVKHTPGPWIVEKVSDGYQICYNCLGNWLAEVFSDGTSEEIAEADAHLIAAAPDLLEQLRDAEELLTQTLKWRGGGWECSEDELLGDIRAAIAKAEGRS